MEKEQMPLLEVKDLKKYFPVKSKNMFSKERRVLHAVDGVSFTMGHSETLGIVGESGCGKTTVGKTILNLYHPTSGQVLFEGKNIAGLSPQAMKEYRKQMQIIFQDPYSSLNPRMRVEDIIAEPLRIYKVCEGARLKSRVKELLDMVGLSSWHARRYPHEFSGGQRQRVGIARALALEPKFIVCDEPVSALDVSVQSQVLNLLINLKKNLGLSYLFIAHGMAVVKHISDRVGVMYLGKMLEIAPKNEIYAHPLHPYTQALMSAIPIPDPDVSTSRILLQGEIPSAIDPPAGCRFCGRCAYATEKCRLEEPAFQEVSPGHFVACHQVSTVEVRKGEESQ